MSLTNIYQCGILTLVKLRFTALKLVSYPADVGEFFRRHFFAWRPQACLKRPSRLCNLLPRPRIARYITKTGEMCAFGWDGIRRDSSACHKLTNDHVKFIYTLAIYHFYALNSVIMNKKSAPDYRKR